jgi:hypothetical protein
MSRWVWMLTLAGLFVALGCEQKPADRTSRKVAPDKVTTEKVTTEKVTSEDVRRDAGKAVDTAAEYSRQAKEEFQKKLDAQLKERADDIAKLREKGRDLKDQAKADWDRKMAELETKREAANAKAAEVGRSSAEAWKDVQKGAQSAYDDLDKAFRDASKEF